MNKLEIVCVVIGFICIILNIDFYELEKQRYYGRNESN